MPDTAPASRPFWRRPLTAWRVAAWTLALFPLSGLVYSIAAAQLGPNPVEFLEHYTGLWSLRLLLACLAMTPLRRLTGRPEPVQIRRLLGLWAFAWLCGHFVIYLTFDLEWSPAALADDLVKRTYITLGFLGWLLLVPLAITSTRGWQRRLKRAWQRLHRLIYAAALLGTLHFVWLVKSDLREPLLYLAIFAGLMAARWPRGGILRAPVRTEPRRDHHDVAAPD
jgi:sulfoxide reductase heme-binding subunit YedZ